LEIDIEKTVLAELIIDPNPENYTGKINESHFQSERNKAIYKAIVLLVEKGTNLDPLTISSVCPEYDNYIMFLVEAAISSANIENHIEALIMASERRRLIEAGRLFINRLECNTAPPDAITEILQAVEGVNRKKASKTFKDASAEMVDELERRKNGKQDAGLRTGWTKFDQMVCFEGGRFYVIAARPGVGKSTMAIMQAMNFAIMEKKIMFYSLEMSAGEIASRIYSGLAKIPLEKLSRGKMQLDDYANILRAIEQRKNVPLEFADSSYTTIEDIIFDCKKRHAQGNLDAVFIDYLQLLTTSNKGSNRYETITNISGELKRLARTLNIPVITPAQLARAGQNRTDKSPQLHDLRDSGAIEQDADTVIMLDRPGASGGSEPEEYTKVYVRKNRNGKLGELEMRFSGKYQLFTEV
jgi:replicative DNA helicase